MGWHGFGGILVAVFTGLIIAGGIVGTCIVLGGTLLTIGVMGLILTGIWAMAMFRRDLWNNEREERLPPPDTRTWLGRQFDAFARHITPRWVP